MAEAEDKLAQPNQAKKNWKGIAPGASFADGGEIEPDVAGAIPDDDGSSAFAAADRPRPPISGPQDQPSGDQPFPRRNPRPTMDIAAGPYSAIPDDGERNPDKIRSDHDMSPGNLEQRGAMPPEGQGGGGDAQSAIQYILGAGGTDPETAKKFAQPDKHKGVSDDDANLLAVHHAFEMGGPAAAWAMVQYNRTAYNGNAAFAKAALNGVDGKAGDIAAAADAATKASRHMLDGSSVHFTPGEDGITATVKLPGTSQTQQIPLTTQQFVMAVDPMGEGQYDKVRQQGGMGAHLVRMARWQAAHPAPDSEAVKTGRPVEYSLDAYPDMQMPRRGGASGKGAGNQPAIPGTHDAHGHYLGPKESSDPEGYGAKAQRRSTSIFGKGNINAEQGRQAYMAGEADKEAERANKIGVAAEKGASDREKARITGGYKQQQTETNVQGRKDVADISGQTQRDIEKSRSDDRGSKRAENARLQTERLIAGARNADEKNRAQNFGRLIANAGILSDKEIQDAAVKSGVRLTPGFLQGLNVPDAPAPQAATPQAATPHAAAPGAASPARDPNFYYDANGKKVGRKQ